MHIDDLRISKDIVPDIKALQCLTISELFKDKAERADEPEGDVVVVIVGFFFLNIETRL